MATEKLTKKQLKSQQFKKSKEEREHDKSLKRAATEEQAPANPSEEPPKKKRKTRRGRKGKGRQDHHNRFIIFVGSLPRDITTDELKAHFKSSSPDHIRLRADKGIAFLEFEADTGIQRRMDIALLQHKTTLKGKQINVELTVGGGGNSQDRLQKLQAKNEKLSQERRDRLKDMMTRPKSEAPAQSAANGPPQKGIHPDRANLLK
ncbi:related to Nucleolar protein 6 [Zygosaccharomyces bailii ISA1307]|nr:related to Nucleolar protein 6 [Zygosaccharomyces bailii ISA1307]